MGGPDESGGASGTGPLGGRTDDAPEPPAPDRPADASSSTGPPPAPVPAQPAAPLEGVDLGRRYFFRQFMAEAVQAAASVVGAANALQRSSSEAANAMLGLGQTVAATVPQPALEEPFEAPPAAGFRSPFRMEGDRLVLLDQRRFPDEVVESSCTTAAEAAAAIRERRVQGSGSIAQVAAYGLCLTADRARSSTPYSRRAVLRGSAQVLREAAPIEMQLRRALDRLLAAWEEVGDLAEDGDAVADRLHAKADAMALELPQVYARLATVGTSVVPVIGDRPVRVLTIGETGPLACGQVGSAFGVVRDLALAGRGVEVYVGETRPALWGARLTTWELAQAGIAHTVLADAAIGWLLAEGRVDVALVGASRIAANGDVAATLGTYPLAVLAARHGIPLHVCVPLATIDPLTPSGQDLAVQLRDAAEVTALQGQPIAPPGTDALNPAFDVTPAELVSGVVTEVGVLAPPFAASFGLALARAGLLPAAPIVAAPTVAAPTVAAGPAAGPPEPGGA